MNNLKISEAIFENHFELYEHFCKLNNCKMISTKYYKSTFNKKNSWPNFVYGINKILLEPELNEILQQIENKNIADIIIFNNEYEPCKTTLSNYGIKKIAVWEAMAINLNNYYSKTTVNELIIKEIETNNDITNWIKIVQNKLKIEFTSEEIKNLISSPKTELYIAYYNNIAVNSGLLFYNKQIVGIHMIATELGYENKSFANNLIMFMLNVAKEKNIDTAVLASTKMAVNLYNKIGFKKYDNFNIYWKINQ
jgi:ribosomal protein S18 acetylase RimI-like enzyme